MTRTQQHQVDQRAEQKHDSGQQASAVTTAAENAASTQAGSGNVAPAQQAMFDAARKPNETKREQVGTYLYHALVG